MKPMYFTTDGKPLIITTGGCFKSNNQNVYFVDYIFDSIQQNSSPQCPQCLKTI